ncbi:MAG TPA: response regulator [Oscillospiraceae bacterium]|nr:response regulator [Oscillospiraceae bacterium]
MIKTIVVDDEWYNLEEICDLVEKTGFMSVDGRYQNGDSALKEVTRISPQAAFIDIEMPEMDGLTLAEKLLEQNPEMKIVFITGWNRYAVAAFELNALDYIMKPINKERFNKMAERLKTEIHLKEPAPESMFTIHCYGGFEALINGKPVVWQRTKAEELFAYLLINHDVYVHKDVILENLWPDYERTKSLPILQTSICKIRNVFSAYKNHMKLTYADNKYGLFLSDVNCDFFDVENAILNFKKGKPETYKEVESACVLFQKGFLPHNGYLWSEICNEDIRQKLAVTLRDVAEMYHIKSDTKKEQNIQKLLSQLTITEEDE